MKFLRFLPLLACSVVSQAQEIGIKVYANRDGAMLAASRALTSIRNFPVLGDMELSAFAALDRNLSLGVGPEKRFQLGKSNVFATVGFAADLYLNSRDRLSVRGGIIFGLAIKTN